MARDARGPRPAPQVQVCSRAAASVWPRHANTALCAGVPLAWFA